MILLIDNYDSFTFNLYQALAVLGAEVEVLRNDAMGVAEMLALGPEAIVLSPGPGRPEGAGVCMEILASMPKELPLMGVCLGHQALVLSAGGELEIDQAPVHGKASPVSHDGAGLFEGLPNPFDCGRYHSLRAQAESLPADLERTAWTADGLIMGVRHKHLPRYGVQFHPESILSPLGPKVLANFLRLVGQTIEPEAMQRALAAVGQEPVQ
ncbi:MAG: anthranilate synthase component 2 [Planctomycetota bacterium]|jgi:anthranilate synthase component 2